MRDQHGHHHGHGDHRTHKFDPANVERLFSEERRRELDPERVLRAAGIGPGMVVGDLGCGPGFFAVPAGRLVGETGYVYAVDVQPEMVALARQTVAASGLANVEVIQSEEFAIPLPDGSLDRAFVAFVLHETEDPVRFLTEVRRLLKATGELVIVDWRKVAGPPGPPVEHRIGEDEAEAIAARAGFRLLERRALDEHRYMLRLAPQSD